MKTCHVCFFECDEMLELCPKCGAELKNAEETEAAEDTVNLIAEPTLVVSVGDVITAEIYRDILMDNGIPFTCDSAEADGSMKVLFGGGFVTEDIYVDASNLEKAKELYEQVLEMLENEDFEADFEEIEEETE
ncbi:MAG: hypothetical protein E7561_05645 [Ruminococcaceae bacterium]|nr:hypothetical protein [Oscillospiraceae bacterium]